MIRIRTTNHNWTRVPCYPENSFSLSRPCSFTRRWPRVCCTRRFWPTEAWHVSLWRQIKCVESIQPLFHSTQHSTNHWRLIPIESCFQQPFSTAIGHGLRGAEVNEELGLKRDHKRNLLFSSSKNTWKIKLWGKKKHVRSYN